jgi:hypothetical protein
LRPCPLHQVQEHAGRLRREGKTRFTSADLRPTLRPANSFEPRSKEFDRYDSFGNIQFFKFLRVHDTTPEQLPMLLKRKADIIEAARHDHEMQPGGDEEEQGKQLHEILFSAWRKVIAA